MSSLASINTTVSARGTVHVEDKMDFALVDMSDKRSSTREDALKTMCSGLCHYRYHWANNHLDVILSGGLRCASKGQTKERLLALKLLSMSAVTVGDEGEQIVDETEQTLRLLITDHKRPSIKAAAIQTYSVTAFATLCEDAAERCMELCDDLFCAANPESEEKHPDPVVTVAALHGWALLATCQSLDKLRELHEIALDDFSALLEVDHVDVRTAAAENIALLTDMFSSIGKEDRPPHAYDAMPELPDLLEALMRDSSKKVSRQDKLKQRGAMRSVMSTLEDGESPIEKVVVKGSTINVTGWSQLMRLDTMRQVLGSGLLHHLQDNSVMHTVFKIEASSMAIGPKTEQEKKWEREGNADSARARNTDRERNRASKQGANQVYGYGDLGDE